MAYNSGYTGAQIDSAINKINNLLNLIYPIGSIYMSVNSTSPATFIGGTWERIQDKFLLAAGSSYSAGGTGGEATHTLTQAEMPTHHHSLHKTIDASSSIAWGGEPYTSTGAFTISNWSYASSRTDTDLHGGNCGGSAAHNNMPPYLAVYIWKRTA